MLYSEHPLLKRHADPAYNAFSYNTLDKNGCPLAWLSKSTSVSAADAEVPAIITTCTRSVKKCKGKDKGHSVYCGFDGYSECSEEIKG